MNTGTILYKILPFYSWNWYKYLQGFQRTQFPSWIVAGENWALVKLQAKAWRYVVCCNTYQSLLENAKTRDSPTNSRPQQRYISKTFNSADEDFFNTIYYSIT